MSAENKISKAEQRVNKLERQSQLLKIKKRKADTRRKIELGGLVIKAQMGTYPKDVILGALIEARRYIESDQSVRRLFKTKGELAFLNKETEHD